MLPDIQNIKLYGQCLRAAGNDINQADYIYNNWPLSKVNEVILLIASNEIVITGKK